MVGGNTLVRAAEDVANPLDNIDCYDHSLSATFSLEVLDVQITDIVCKSPRGYRRLPRRCLFTQWQNILATSVSSAITHVMAESSSFSLRFIG